MPNRIFTLAERPELRAQISGIHNLVWPRFMRENDIANRVWPLLFEAFADFQVALCDDSGTVLAAGNAMPVVWGGTLEDLPEGWEAAKERGLRDYEDRRAPTALSAYAIVVAPEHQGQGHSGTVLEAMRRAARGHGLHTLIAAVRPTLKALYPLTPIERYALWTREDGSAFDPWVRVHLRAGGEQLGIAPVSMVITGRVADWEDWTGLSFPESGPYVVPGALQPVTIDIEGDLGRYEDPNIWVLHRP